jgi:hypothetical protein
VEVLCRVFILRIIAAAYMTACYAKSQMNPFVANFQTLFTAIRGSRSDLANFKQMRTATHYSGPPNDSEIPIIKVYGGFASKV